MERYSKKEIVDFMRSKSIASLASCDGDKPISSIILFAIDDDFTMYFGTHRDTFKSQSLLKNPNVSLSVWDFKKMLVQMSGKAHEIKDKSDAKAAIDKITSSVTNIDDFWPPVLQLVGSSYIVFKIRLEWLRVLDLTRQTISRDDQPMQEVKFEKAISY